MPRILCTLFGHRRDSRRAHPSSNGWRAPCGLCGERLERVAPGRWRVVRNEQLSGFLTPYADVPRQPFSSASQQADGERDGEGARGAHHARQPQQSDDGDRTRRLLRELFEHPPLADQCLDQTRPTGGEREKADRPSEAEMFAIAFAGCREMLFRLSDHFALRASSAKRFDEPPTSNR